MNALRSAFRPELINRIDEIIIFNSLKEDVVSKILDKIIKEMESRLQNYRVKINVSDKARKKIIDEAYDVNYGARPIKRYVTKYIESLIAHKIIEDNISLNTVFEIDVKNDKFVIEKL